MLTTIVCLVSLLGAPQVQRLTFRLTEVNASELRQAYPGQTLQHAVCNHLDRAMSLSSEE